MENGNNKHNYTQNRNIFKNNHTQSDGNQMNRPQKLPLMDIFSLMLQNNSIEVPLQTANIKIHIVHIPLKHIGALQTRVYTH